mgnify:CR=1 FL=1
MLHRGSVSGDLAAKRASQVHKAFPKPIKKAGQGPRKGFKG